MEQLLQAVAQLQEQDQDQEPVKGKMNQAKAEEQPLTPITTVTKAPLGVKHPQSQESRPPALFYYSLFTKSYGLHLFRLTGKGMTFPVLFFVGVADNDEAALVSALRCCSSLYLSSSILLSAWLNFHVNMAPTIKNKMPITATMMVINNGSSSLFVITAKCP